MTINRNLEENENFIKNINFDINLPINQKGQNILHMACIFTNKILIPFLSFVIRILLKRGADINFANPLTGETALHIATQ